MRPGEGPGGRYVYCIVPFGHEPDAGERGVAGEPVGVVEVRGLVAWVSPLTRRPSATLDAVRAHNRVIERAMTEAVTPVPLRFGQWFPAEADARAAIERDAARWAELLERFSSAAEYGLRLALRDAAARVVHREEAGGGAAYLRTRARQRAGALDEGGRAVVELVRDRLGGLIREERARRAATPGGGVEIAHLVAHDRRQAYIAGVEALHAEQPRMVFLSSGPWPPYSFVP